MKIVTLFVSMAISVLAYAQDAKICPMHEQHQQAPDQHDAGVDTRGDHAMGFSHQKSAHHFFLLPDGGTINVAANDPNDTTTRDEIRTHLSHVAGMFADGNFEVPMFIHDTMPPGVEVMKTKRNAITYRFEPTPSGGRVRLVSTDRDAVKAIHQFLAFQIDDHRTGDSKTIALDVHD
jgi:hypothetical protein